MPGNFNDAAVVILASVSVIGAGAAGVNPIAVFLRLVAYTAHATLFLAVARLDLLVGSFAFLALHSALCAEIIFARSNPGGAVIEDDGGGGGTTGSTRRMAFAFAAVWRTLCVAAVTVKTPYNGPAATLAGLAGAWFIAGGDFTCIALVEVEQDNAMLIALMRGTGSLLFAMSAALVTWEP